MRNIRTRLYRFLAIAVFPISASVFAEQTPENSISGHQLLLSCRAFSNDAAALTELPCASYIRGYLAGVWGLRNVTTASLAEIDREPSTWADRAYHSRVGARPDFSSSSGVTYFCGPIDQSEKRIVVMLAKQGLAQIQSLRDLNSRIDNAIKAVCPSDKKTGGMQ